mmetsp:Transcript_35594/g.80275  ORF Transcript_35594/g.80275 Transcript_35594/m.80275 type:complete len:664 (-) Transcript_35594:104-2095(-)|eukprot:CAMPEP_0172609678 /NCGR_PEP_ID=MMETSP1068-20121228/29619_1 /TAXON_ID=35684 /ORGANISM="Pseudopedinella elastica, Strain CCMP716" /LENGTH=663 /DNA_ID=CAMNT_0013413241 /DNA_START=65 /DNA_END=2056 /DNA_ORIENTATION=-
MAAPTEALSGYAEKKSRLGVWNKRFFVLLKDDHYLLYYPDDKKDRGPNGMKGGHLDLRHCNLIKMEKKVLVLWLHDKSKYVLRFGQESEARRWKAELYNVVKVTHIDSDGVRPPTPRSPSSQTPSRTASFPTTPRGEWSPRENGSLPDPLDMDESEDGEPEEPASSLPAYFALRLWAALGLCALVSSVAAIFPAPTLDLWFFKVFVLSGVLHASVISLLGLAAAASALAVLTESHLKAGRGLAPKGLRVPPRAGSSSRVRPSVCLLALWSFGAALLVVLLPALSNLPLAARLPEEVAGFLRQAGLQGEEAQGGANNNALSVAAIASHFLVDPPCALANVWEYFPHSDEVVYKALPGEPPAGDKEEEDWSGFGGLSRRNGTETGLRLAIFGAPCPSCPRKPALLSLHGGGWYKGGLYDGLQCYLPAALEAGYAVVAAEYRSGSAGWRGREMVEDARDLIKWVVSHGGAHGLDPERIVGMGGSAGAHVGLTAALALNKKEEKMVVKGFVARYGAVGDLAEAHASAKALPRGLGEALSAWRTPGDAAAGKGWSERLALEHIAGGTPGEGGRGSAAIAAEYAFLSPPNHLSAWSPPVISLHCAQDEFYDLGTHAEALAAAYKAAHRPHLLIAPALHSHGCDIGSTVPFQLTRYALTQLLGAVKRAGN